MYTNISISKQQAKEIAMAITADIKSYIESHQEEYELFLREEQLESNKNSQSDILIA